ncbi:MAG TPA: hypothetical protein VFA42_04800 [Gaiellaceae bacterium]|nr:hypothetical protein [Gaiellaceae bacterium]
MKLVLAAAVLTAHFTATSVSGTASRTCGTVTATSATYSGTGTTIVAHSTIDASNGMGVVTGTLKTATLAATFSAVYDHGAISGTASGHEGSRTIVASISALFSPTAGFTHGVLGGRGSGGLAVLGGGCGAPQQLRQAQGAIRTVNAGEITVGGLTCEVPPALALKVAASYPAGSWAAISCSVSNGQPTLVTIRAKR